MLKPGHFLKRERENGPQYQEYWNETGGQTSGFYAIPGSTNDGLLWRQRVAWKQ